jgi:hypothetical protein
MLTGRRVVVLASGATFLALLTGGVAWAGSQGAAPSPRGHAHAAFDVTTSAGATSTGVDDPTTTFGDTSTTFGDTSTTLLDDTTTTIDVGSTTTVPETTSTAVSTTTAPTPTRTGPVSCKPGWGYGDTNHCHSGPPGLHKTNPKKAGSRHAG